MMRIVRAAAVPIPFPVREWNCSTQNWQDAAKQQASAPPPTPASATLKTEPISKAKKAEAGKAVAKATAKKAAAAAKKPAAKKTASEKTRREESSRQR